MDLNFEWVERKRGGKGASNDSFVAFSVTGNGKNKDGTTRSAFVINFYEKAIKKFRLIKGDRISIGFDKNAKLVAIKRVSGDGGYSISKMGNQLRVQIPFDAYPFVQHNRLYVDENGYFEESNIFIFNLSKFNLKLK